MKFKFCENNEFISSWSWVLNCLFLISMLSSIHSTMSVYGRILGLTAIRCKNEQASSVMDTSKELCEPAVAVTLGLSSSSRLYMPSHVAIPVSLLQVVSVYKGAISFSSELRALLFFPILRIHLYHFLFSIPAIHKWSESNDKEGWWEGFKCRRRIKYTILCEMIFW